MPVFSQFFHIISPLLPSHLVFLMLEASEQTNEPNCNGSIELFLLQQCDLGDTQIVFS